MAKKRDLVREVRAKLQPKLQMIANGSSDVNAVRAGRCAALRVTTKRLEQRVATRRDAGAAAAAAVSGKGVKRLPARGTLARLAPDVEASVFIRLNEGQEGGRPFKGEVCRKGNLVSARVRLSDLPALSADDRVAFVEIGETLDVPRPKVTAGTMGAPASGERRVRGEALHKFGEDRVLIGIIDVQGFDFSHPDFLDAKGRTRWIAIWDQGGDARPSPKGTQFAYGAEFLKPHLDAAIAAALTMGVPAWEIERQSQLAEGSHGTHVASTAAGNRGVCRRSPIAGVQIALRGSDDDRRSSFYDSTRIADAVDYLVALGARMKLPVSINISLGTNGHAHDGTGAIGRWIDSVLSTPGRVVSVAAGNAGQERSETPDDMGWINGRIHASGQVPAAGLTADLEWVVVGNGVVDVSENELELWFSAQDRFDVSLRTPAGEWIGPVESRQFIENRRLADGSFLSIYNELYHPSNGANYISLYLSPNLRADPIVGVSAGTWVVRLHGREIRDGSFHGWIERDDARRVSEAAGREYWAFPSFFTERSMRDDSTVSSLGCGQSVITVANLEERYNRINVSSSQGPTRDGRLKPDVAARGTDIVAARGFSQNGEAWIGMTGTSMASPFVCGVAGLMLAIEPKLTAAQVEGIIRSTAKPLPGANYRWTNDAGFGVIDPEKCLEQAANASERSDRTHEEWGA